MIRQDYILRVIEQFGQVWARIVDLLRAGRCQEALEALDAASQRFLGLSTRLMDLLSSEDLVRMIGVGDSLDRGKAVVLVELLRERGEVLSRQGKLGDAVAMRLKALDVFLEVREEYNNPRLLERRTEMDAMIAELRGYELSPKARRGLISYWGARAWYADAEDALFDLLERGGAEDEMVREGLAFYDRLLAKSDAELEAGGLPRDEVLEGMERLREIGAGDGGGR